MKKLSILFLVLCSAILMSCEKESLGDAFGGGESIPPYVTITSKTTLAAVEGTSATIPVNLRTAMQEDVTVSYAISGAFTATGTVTILRNASTANAIVAVPSSLVKGTATSVNAIFKLTGAKTATSGVDLTLGQLGATLETKTIRVVKNLVMFASSSVTVTESISAKTIKIPVSFSSALKANTSITYNIVPAAGNTSNNLQMGTTGTFVSAAGKLVDTILVTVNDDAIVNATNEYSVNLVSATAAAGSEVYVDPANSVYAVTVKDDLKEVNFANTVSVDVAQASNKNFTITLSSPSPNTVSIPFTITGGEANDYVVRTTNPIVFSPGSTSSNINIDILSTYTPGNILTITLGTPVTTDGEVSVGTDNEVVINLK